MTITEAVDSIIEAVPDVSRSKIKRAFSSALKQGKSISAARELVLLASRRGALDGRVVAIAAFQPTEHEAQLRSEFDVPDEHGQLPGARVTAEDPSRTVAKHAAAGV